MARKTRKNQKRKKDQAKKGPTTNVLRSRNLLILAGLIVVLAVAGVAYQACGHNDHPAESAASNGTPSGGAAAPTAPPVAPGTEVTTPTGLKYVDERVGTGASPQPGSQVTVNYLGTLTNGTKFDSSYDHGQPFTFTIGRGQVIRGWDEGVMSMKVGGKRKLIIPPDLGYGARGAGASIPPNSTLNFEVELLGVQ